MYSWTVFMPKMLCPTWDSILLADTTLAKAGNFINSCNWHRHFLSSDRSTFVPNLNIFEPWGGLIPGTLCASTKQEPFRIRVFSSANYSTVDNYGRILTKLQPFFLFTFPVESFESESDKLLELTWALDECVPPIFSRSSYEKNRNETMVTELAIWSGDWRRDATVKYPYLQRILKTRRLVLSVFRYSGVRSMTDASPAFAAVQLIPIFVAALLYLRSNFD